GEWRKNKLNLLDTPGYANFLAEARAALRVADAAVVVVDAGSGVGVQTQKGWAYAEEFGLPRLVVVNRMDRERASYLRTLESLQAAFGRAVVPLSVPLGEEKGFVGVADLVADKADVYSDDASGKVQQVAVPPEVAEGARSGREQLVEMVAESNEDMIETFFESGTLSQEDLVRGLRQAVLAGKLFPVFATPSQRNVGMHPLLDAIVDLLPSPADRGPAAGTDPARKAEATREPRADRPPSRPAPDH